MGMNMNKDAFLKYLDKEIKFDTDQEVIIMPDRASGIIEKILVIARSPRESSLEYEILYSVLRSRTYTSQNVSQDDLIPLDDRKKKIIEDFYSLH